MTQENKKESMPKKLVFYINNINCWGKDFLGIKVNMTIFLSKANNIFYHDSQTTIFLIFNVWLIKEKLQSTANFN